MYESCLKKQQQIIALFSECKDNESRYEKIIELGRKLPKIDPGSKKDENLVRGCQSRMYLQSKMQGNHIYFAAESDALISSGLAALLIKAYSDEAPEVVIKCPPEFLETLNISHTITPSRANGLYSLHLKMKQEALKFLS